VKLVFSAVHEFEVAGDSAWGPPLELVRFISEQFHLWAVVTYDEPGMGFAGAEAYRDGEQVYDGGFDYDDVELPEVDWDADNCDEQYDDFAFAVLREIEIREDAAHAFLLEVTA